MSPAGLKPTSRFDLVKRLRRLGWSGPQSGGKHQFMVKGTHKLRIPNPHTGDISVALLRVILKQAGIDVDEWTTGGK